ncbi:hypothetical protein K450DRAFT_243943 [Umbelopsis ramanniana AG]|uniref:Uncharacterized protein n=1 Tax=Umbelopsis ramanniana AG TaxID=1314678 RepID=A0AAD5E909_UMBRA|nr:uncharacterized protein K450DRAFT_243943 [Umbelopsis ramanniana AG]KAI8579114.1 hypothetical protein K450DRAFT_243943 [Umbelopsis ramanniana AG]
MLDQWQFTDLYKQSNKLCRFSPDGNYVAVAVEKQLVVRSHPDLGILQVYYCKWPIDALAWSPNSKMISTTNYAACECQCYTMEDVGWSCQYKDASRPIAHIRWSPGSDAVMHTASTKERLHIMSLRYNKRFSHIKNVKHKDKGYTSSPDAKWFAYLRRQDLKDVVSIYDAESFEVIKNIELDTVDAQDIIISPNGGFIAAYDVPLLYKLSVYRPDGTMEASFSVDDGGLGIKSVCWSPDSQFLAVGGYDHKLRLLDTFTWKPVSTFTHQTRYPDNPAQEILIEREVMSGTPHAGYDIRHGIQHIPMLRPDHDRPNPKTSITAKFNNLGNLMLTTSETIPTTACIWNMTTMKSHAIIVQQEPILTALWNPKISSLLAICCEGGRFYLWQDRRHEKHRSHVTAINIPAEKFSISTVRWSPDGKSLLLMSKDMFCLAWPIDS